MRKGIHPDYKPAKITCVCGNVIETHSTKGDYGIQICSRCHPFFTGKQKFVDAAGRVERFQRRYAQFDAVMEAEKRKAAATQPDAPEPKPAPEPKAAPEPAPAKAATGPQTPPENTET